jgi:hypothetical protein
MLCESPDPTMIGCVFALAVFEKPESPAELKARTW